MYASGCLRRAGAERLGSVPSGAQSFDTHTHTHASTHARTNAKCRRPARKNHVACPHPTANVGNDDGGGDISGKLLIDVIIRWRTLALIQT